MCAIPDSAAGTAVYIGNCSQYWNVLCMFKRKLAVMVLVEHHYYDTVYCVKQCLFSGDFTGNRRTDVGTDYRKYFHKNLLYLNCKTVAGDIDMGSDDTEKKQSVFKMAGVAVDFTDSDCGGIYPD